MTSVPSYIAKRKLQGDGGAAVAAASHVQQNVIMVPTEDTRISISSFRTKIPVGTDMYPT